MSKKRRAPKRQILRNQIVTRAPGAVHQSNGSLWSNLGVAGGFCILMVVYYWLFGRFFPNANGSLGPDYSYFGPALLDGYYWFHVNGLFHVPWFTPSFCGGSLVFPNLQRSFYSFPQFLTFLVDPLIAIRTTVFLFALIGGTGFYLLLRRAFQTSRWAAFLGGGLFLFNGFYSHRMIIGHFGYHTFMLLPLVALFLLRPLSADCGSHARKWRILFDASVAATLIAFMATSDFITLLIPALLSVIIVGLLHGLLHGRKRDFWKRMSLACAFAALLTSAKLTAIIAFMKNAPRSDYLLPGVDSLFHSFIMVARSLFLGAEIDPMRSDWVRNAQWLIGQHEWEYSVSFVPFVFLAYGFLKFLGLLWKGAASSLLSRFKTAGWLSVTAISIILIIPVLLNVYSPGWNAFLKTIPIIQSSSILFRWFILYIPCFIVAASLIIDRIFPEKFHAAICISGLVCCLAVKASHQNTYYSTEGYLPQPIIQAYYEVKAGKQTPEITTMGWYQDDNGKPQIPINRNDTFTHGVSQILAYESLFGYRLEYLPLKTLHPGSVFDTAGGVLNVKNPASYLWPKENHCLPGDHFKIDEKASAQAFLQYKPFPFRTSLLQKVADWTTLCIALAMVIFQIGFIFRKLRSYRFSNPHLRPLPRPVPNPGTDAGIM